MRPSKKELRREVARLSALVAEYEAESRKAYSTAEGDRLRQGDWALVSAGDRVAWMDEVAEAAYPSAEAGDTDG